MNNANRIVIFCVGAVIGTILVNKLLDDRAEKKNAADAFEAARRIPGMLVDYAQAGRPVYGDGVLAEATGPGADGFPATRRVITGGRNRLDDMGRALPMEYLEITEYYSTPGPLTANTRVKRYDFRYADRIRVTVKDPADTAVLHKALASVGAHLRPDAGSRTAVTAYFNAPKIGTVDEALRLAKAVPGVLTAEPVTIDWVAEIRK